MRLVDLVMELANSIVSEGVVLVEWEVSSIVNRYKEQGDALERGNYGGLMICSLDSCLDLALPDATLFVRQLQEKSLIKKKKVYFAFVDMEKALGMVHDVVCSRVALKGYVQECWKSC